MPESTETKAPDPAIEAIRQALEPRFRDVEALGSGASSLVFRAVDRSTGLAVAVKVLRPQFAAALGASRFTREIGVAGRLQHPNIVPLIDSGLAGSFHFYVMPLVVGETLRERLTRQGALPVEEAVHLAVEVARGLQFAHDQGVLHRDVKPGNILLGADLVALADFGLARVLTDERGQSLTSSGVIVGTAPYMSPEQGSGDPVDARTDQYALACVLFEMLTGSPPFYGTTILATLAKHRVDERPSVRRHRETVAPHIDAAIRRAMAIVPADRFPTVQAFAEVVAGPGPLLPSVPKPVRRWAIATVAAIAVAVAANLIGSPSNHDRLDAGRVAIAPFDIFDPADSVWRMGLVDLFARNFDVAGLLEPVPPSVVARRWIGRADRPSALALAERTGASLVLYGQLTRAGADGWRLRATLSDLATDRNLTDVELEGQSNALTALVDSVTILALQGLSRTRRVASVREAGYLTRSLPALKEFLRGEQYYRANDLANARSHYEAALAADSGFAVAARRLRGVHRALGSEFDSLSLAYALRAGRLNRGLGRRDSLLIVADSLAAVPPVSNAFYDLADLRRLRRRLDALMTVVREYPADPDARMELAEAWYHLGDRVGIGADQVLDAFVRAIEREPGFGPPYYHAIALSLGLHGSDSARRLTEQYLEVHPGDRRFQLVRLLLGSSASDRRAVSQLLAALSTDSILGAAEMFRIGSAAQARVAERLYQAILGRVPRADSGGRIETLQLLALLYAGRGRMAAAAQLVDEGLALSDLYTTVSLGAIDAVPRSTVDSILLTQLRRGGRSNALYALGWFGGRFALDWLPKEEQPEPGSSLAAYLDKAMAGYQALGRADTGLALEYLAALPESVCSALCHPQRVLAATLLLSRGRAAEAAVLLDRYPPPADDPWFAPAWRDARAAVAWAVGDSARAGAEATKLLAALEPGSGWSDSLITRARGLLALLPQRPTPD
ncbi:MAG: protein kinase domain-containing protein [Gemmatimonadales bacterium]